MRLYLALAAFLIAVPARGDYPPPAQVRAAFLKQLDRPKVPADSSSPTITDHKGMKLEQFTIASEKKADGSIERVPVIILHPAKDAGKAPAVIVLHGTGGTGMGQMGYLEALAQRGIRGIAIDARYHGQRLKASKGGYVDAITRAWKTKPGEPMEHPFYFDTVWDLWRLTDYLTTRPDIDAKKLGMIGFSMGGIQTWLAASVDERILVSVPAIGVQSFRWSLDNDKWQGRARTIKGAHDTAAKDLGQPEVNRLVCEKLWNKVIPGILDQFDCPSMLRLFVDRPLLILNGTMDANCPYEGAKLAIGEAQKAYAKTPDRLRVIVEEVGHTVTPAQRLASLEWFEKWLK